MVEPPKNIIHQGCLPGQSSSSILGKGRASTGGANRTTPRSLKCTMLEQHRVGGLILITKHIMMDIHDEHQFYYMGYHEKYLYGEIMNVYIYTLIWRTNHRDIELCVFNFTTHMCYLNKHISMCNNCQIYDWKPIGDRRENVNTQ